MQKSIVIFLEPYLAQWWKFSLGGEPVCLPKVAVERKFLLAMAVVSDSPQTAAIAAPDGMEAVDVSLPRSLVQPPGRRVFLKQKARRALAEMIRNNFDLALWNDIHTLRVAGVSQMDVIWSWMEANGIELTEKNFNSIAKRYQRLRKAYFSRLRIKKFRQK